MDDQVKRAIQPALLLTGGALAIRAGTIFGDTTFDVDTEVVPPAEGYVAGSDYGVMVGKGAATASLLSAAPTTAHVGGFHFALGGNAVARAGGDETPSINPCSLWDVNFRPACADPRGMVYIDPTLVPFASVVAPFWCDIYFTGASHFLGTSRVGARIADGSSLPTDFGDAKVARFDYATAMRLLDHHGKQLLSYDEFRVAAYGVTERTACGADPRDTQLDAPRTSRFGLMQATGAMWIWGHDGDPDEPRASLFGGYWWDGGIAGSRQANVAYFWPEISNELIGARGRCDHLALV